jgi:hypothetical protein
MQPIGDAYLDEYEHWARSRLTPLLGRLRVVDRPGGEERLHDFEADLPDGSLAALEVTSEVDGTRRAQASEVERRGLASFTMPGAKLLWLVGLAAGAQVRTISRDKLGELLGGLEAAGRLNASDLDDYRDPVVQRLRVPGTESVYGLKANAGHEGTVMVRPGTYSGFGWTGPRIDRWLDDLFASPRGANKLGKLSRARAVQRHLDE